MDSSIAPSQQEQPQNVDNKHLDSNPMARVEKYESIYSTRPQK